MLLNPWTLRVVALWWASLGLVLVTTTPTHMWLVMSAAVCGALAVMLAWVSWSVEI